MNDEIDNFIQARYLQPCIAKIKLHNFRICEANTDFKTQITEKKQYNDCQRIKWNFDKKSILLSL